MQEQQAAIILKDFYWLVGIMVIMNVGTIITVLLAAGKTIWWASSINVTVKRNTKDIKAAHDLIREVKSGDA